LTVATYAGCILLALEHIHSQGYAYRDLKPENIIIGVDGYIKVVDFGFAKAVPYLHKSGQMQYRTFTLCGTPDYMAPEVVLTQGHDASADFWAYGVLIYELLCGHTPFAGKNQQRTFEKIVHSQKHLTFPQKFDAHAKSLIRRLLHPNASLRIGCLQNKCNDVKEHAFFVTQNVSFVKLMTKTTPISYRPELIENTDKSIPTLDAHDEYNAFANPVYDEFFRDLSGINTTNDTVNYTRIRQYIDEAMLPFLKTQLGWNPYYVKFRISNNNNSTDASMFHRDVICYDSQKRTYPIFTFLSYLDPTVMQVFPYSHDKHTMNTYQALKARYYQCEQIALKPGDLLLFRSTLLHRGIFTQTDSPNRRLLQIFDVYPTEELYKLYSPRVLQIKTVPSPVFTKFMIKVSKVKLGIELLDLFSSLNAASGYGYDSRPLAKTGMEKLGFSYTSVTHKSLPESYEANTWQPNNLYVMCQPSVFAPEESAAKLHFIQYSQGVLFYAIQIVFLSVIIFMVLF